MSTGAGTLRIGRSFAFRIWLAFAVIVIAASITLALVITRSSAPAVRPATGDARVGTSLVGTVPVEAGAPTKSRVVATWDRGGLERAAKSLPPQLLKVDEQLGG